jgi:acetyl esterase/lipase
MPLDRHVQRLLNIVTAGQPDVARLEPEAMRRAMAELARLVDVKDVPIHATEDREIPGPASPLPIRIYTPLADSAGALPALIYFHGGTGVFCGIDTHDGLCRMLANESGCRVISVGYRLAPEHKFPAAVEDSCVAAQWICDHSEELGIDPKRLAVGGDSAGATLAAVVCQLARSSAGPEIALQVLICPVTDIHADTVSRRMFGQGYFFDAATLTWALGHYLKADADTSDPRISPLRADDFRELPAAQIHTAEFDPFRDEGRQYADALDLAGVRVRYTCHPGMIHHFYCMAGAIPSARSAISTIGHDIKAALSQVGGSGRGQFAARSARATIPLGR